MRESDIVLDISRQVASRLEEQGVQVIMTRQDDREVDLSPRVQLANRARSNLFVSIHANAISLSRPDVNGLETYYYSSAGERLAQVIHDTVLQMTGVRNRQVRFARFYVLRHTSMPAVLVEVGFVTGEEDARRLSDPAFRTQMAEAIAAGILRYVQQNL
ncbi:N-acetylmuramoyl-L-alanine amidase family protein [Egbenema bharatensis]|uniref:N-acetylmuramoyl-L-alanine amidase family protein n=1 Tax=Egbenema bharatensis TaxID=3463334 RepID=UPI003A853275